MRGAGGKALATDHRDNMSNPALNTPTVLASASLVEQNTPAVSHLQQKQTGL